MAAVAAMLLAQPLGSASAQDSAQDSLSVRPAFAAGTWLTPDAALELRLSRPLAPDEGRLAVWVGTLDVSAMLESAPGRLTYRPRTIPLPAGETEVTVYLVSPDQQWRELGRFPLRVLTPRGFEKAEIVPRAALTNKGQVAEGHRPEANRPPRAEFQDFSANIGLQSVHVGGGWHLRSQSNFLAVTNRQEALRFAERQERAPRVDLSDYLVTVGRGADTLTVGHVAFGAHRHLLTGFQSRGLTTALRIGPIARLSLAGLGGSTLVGWSYPLGVERPSHRILSGNLALEVLPRRPGVVHLDAALLRGAVLPQAGFTQGAVNDAEESRGAAVRLAAGDPSQRLRLEAGYARSRFTNPADPLLAQGADLVPVRPTTRDARYLDVTLNALRDVRLTASLPVSATLSLRHERVAPLYRTVAMPGIQADVNQNLLELTTGVGAAALQISHTRAHDNLAQIPTILRTRTRTSSANLSVPFAQMIGSTAPSWLPTLAVALARTHQFGEGVPQGAEGFETFVPDQVSTNRTITAQTQGRAWRVMLQLNRSTQDNRQPGRETADFANSSRALSFGLTPSSAVDLTLDLAQEGARSRERDQENTTRRLGASLAWRAGSATTVSAAVSTTRSADHPRTAKQAATDLRLELSQRLPLLPRRAGRDPAQLFLRYARQSGEQAVSGSPRSSRLNWTLNTGVALGVF